jgi:hypothetical protein
VTLAPGESATHVEDWFLFEAAVGTTEADLDERLLPLVAATDRHLGGP